MTIAERETQSIQETGAQPPKTELEQFLDGITPPQPSPDDDRDPVEAQIYNLLGDITLPRSFLPGARAVAIEHIQRTGERNRHRIKARPNNRYIRDMIQSDQPYEGMSPETDTKFIDEDTSLRFKQLLLHKPMIALRDEAQELYGRYVNSNMKNHSTTESYFMRSSLDLWKRMSATAKDFLLHGDSRYVHLNLEESEVQEFVGKIMHEMDGQLRSRKSNGSVFVDTEETRNSWWDANEIGFKFREGKIISMSIDDYVDRNERSVLVPFLRSITNEGVDKIVNLFNDGDKIGPFDVFFREHDWVDYQYGIAISTEDWSREEIEDFLRKYVAFLQTAKRVAPETESES